MKHRFLSVLVMLVMSVAAMADEVPGITVEYIDNGTSAYMQAISAIGKIKFEVRDEVKHAIIEFKDNEIADEDLGAITEISRISFGAVSENDIATDIKDIKAEGAGIKVTAYPNPTADHVHVDGLQEGQTIRLFSSDGKLVLTSKEADINLAGMSSGIYLLQVGKEVVKIIKK
ncbi:MAG: T9SS type A sorting domain-containing protein [Bacteroidales bacterium]|nr:T9SS type A sorting domain-containing protein [Bacteroidales bacterium]